MLEVETLPKKSLLRHCPITGGTYQHGSFSHVVHLYLHARPQWENRVLPFLFRSPPELFQWFGGLLMEFATHTIAALIAGPFVPTLQRFEQKWLKIGVNLLNNGFPNEATEVFLRWYQLVRENEISHSTRYHKGNVLWWLGRSRQAVRLDDDAKNWFFLAMLEDVRNDANTWQALPARDSIVNGLQVAAAVADGLGNEAANICSAGSWSPTEPDSLWLALLLHKRRFTRSPLPFIKALAQYLLTAATAASLTRKESGDALELLMSYLFAAEKGFEVLGSSRAPDAQNDILIRNSHVDSAVSSMGDYFLIECKNWTGKVRAPVIRELAGRLQSAAVKTGILASLSSISGAKPKTKRSGARLAISKEYLQDQTAILVLDKNRLQDLSAGNESLTTLLLSLFEDVRFDRI